VGIDFEFSMGQFDLFAEIYGTRFETAKTDDLNLLVYYLEAKYTFLPGFFGAVRLGQARFGRIDDSLGESRRWGRDLTRYELGLGYFFTRNLFLKTTLQINETFGGNEPDDNMGMAQLVLTF
jgi:hypothetical protein